MAPRPTRRPAGTRRPGASRRGLSGIPNAASLASQFVATYDGIADEPDPVQLEMAASAIVGVVLPDYWASDDDDAPTPAEPMLALLGELRDRERADDALALALGMQAVAVDPNAQLGRVVTEVIDRLRALGASPGAAAQLAGRARPTSAWTHADVWGDQLTLHVGFGYDEPGVADHTLSLLLDANLGSIKDAFVAPPIDEIVDEIRRETAHVGDDAVLRLEQVDLATATAHLELACEWTEESLGEAVGEDAFELLPLVLSRLDVLLDQALDAGEHPIVRDWFERASVLDELTVGEVVERFVASEQFVAEQRNGACRRSAERLVEWAFEEMDGGVARFGVAAPEYFLLLRLPAVVAGDEERAEHRAGAVATVRAWARLTHELLELPAAALDAVLEGVELAAAHLDAALDGRPGSVMPPGFGARLIAQMEAEGHDPGDPAQLEAFMLDFNERPFEERSRILDGE